MLASPVKIEFNLDRQVTEFNIRENLIFLLQKMKNIDRHLCVRSTISFMRMGEIGTSSRG